MKEIRAFLFGCIILLMAVRAYAVVYDPPVYETPVPISKGEGPLIGEILSLEEYFRVIVNWEVANPGMPERMKGAILDFSGEMYDFSARPDVKVPEPGVLFLLGAGLIVLVILGIRKRKRTATKGKNNP